MKRQSAHLFVAAVLALLGPLAQNGRGDFILYDDEQLTVNSYHVAGELYDTSRVSIISGGYVVRLYAYNYSAANISGGQVTYLYAYNSSAVDMCGKSVHALYAYNSSTVNISGGTLSGYLYAYDLSNVTISGGYFVDSLWAHDSSTVDISGGSMYKVAAYGSSAVNLSGGTVSSLSAFDFGDVTISGGSVNSLLACDSGTVTLYGQNFRVGGGLTFEGNRVLGTGLLSGEWFNGTPWAVNIKYNVPTATIWAIPEPATLLLLGLGAVLLRKKIFK